MGDLLPMRPTTERTAPAASPPLLREVTGEVLRERRHERGERLTDTAGRAGISTQYLSELERGAKDPSSEVLAAVSGALGLTLLDLTVGVARRLQLAQRSAARTGGAPLALAA